MNFFHILALAEVHNSRIVSLCLRLLDERAVGHLGDTGFRFKTGGQIFFGTFDLTQKLQSATAVHFFGKSDHPEKLGHLPISFLLCFFGINLEPQGRFCLACIGLMECCFCIHPVVLLSDTTGGPLFR